MPFPWHFSSKIFCGNMNECISGCASSLLYNFACCITFSWFDEKACRGSSTQVHHSLVNDSDDRKRFYYSIISEAVSFFLFKIAVKALQGLTHQPSTRCRWRDRHTLWMPGWSVQCVVFKDLFDLWSRHSHSDDFKHINCLWAKYQRNGKQTSAV